MVLYGMVIPCDIVYFLFLKVGSLKCISCIFYFWLQTITYLSQSRQQDGSLKRNTVFIALFDCYVLFLLCVINVFTHCFTSSFYCISLLLVALVYFITRKLISCGYCDHHHLQYVLFDYRKYRWICLKTLLFI